MTIAVREYTPETVGQMLADQAARRARIFGRIDNALEEKRPEAYAADPVVSIEIRYRTDAFSRALWTAEQLDKLRLLAARGMHVDAIARAMGRSVHSVQKKAYWLGLKLERKLPSQRPPDPDKPKPNAAIPSLAGDPAIDGLVNRQIVKAVIAHICRELNVSEAYLRSKHRQPYIVDARHQAMWLIARDTTLSLAYIGRLFGTDHSTVIHGVRKQNERRAANVRDLGGVNPNKAIAARRYHQRRMRDRS